MQNMIGQSALTERISTFEELVKVLLFHLRQRSNVIPSLKSESNRDEYILESWFDLKTMQFYFLIHTLFNF